jgi:predicted SAM-dependent methyltransferase
MAGLRPLVKRQIPKGVWRALRELRTEIQIARLHRAAVRKAAALVVGRTTPIRLNLGSGHRPKQGADWINIDLSDTADLQLDLREPLPFADNSVSQIYSEHFFEHLDYPNLDDSLGWDFETRERPSEAMSFLRECRRVLAAGGLLDIVVPDAEGIVGEYVNRVEQGFPKYKEWWGPKWCDTPFHCVNYVFRQGREHKYAYDEETLSSVLRAAGFADPFRRPFDPAMEAENHAIGSLCMRACKRAGTVVGDGSALAPQLSSTAA